MSNFLSCSYASICAGCDWLLKSYEDQRQLKLSHLTEIWNRTVPESFPLPEIEWVQVDAGGLRDRVDLMSDRRSGSHRLGLFDRFRTGIVDLQGCPQLSSNLEAWLKDFRRTKLPVERGSVRLRVSPSGQRGVWLDLANVDVKSLLDERTTLDALRRQATVEIGQRRKLLVEKDGRLKLDDPTLEPWFETYIEDESGQESAVPLYCSIGSFTQPGFRANRALVRTARSMVAASGIRKVAEFGSGIGNFTLPLASVAEEVHAYEVDTLALQGLERTLQDQTNESSIASRLAGRVHIHAGNFQAERKAPIDFDGVDLVFVDPPRSGLMKFLDPLDDVSSADRPAYFVYVSCFAESFAADAARLSQLGYVPDRMAIVDQFPQSRHYEIVASFKK